MDTLVSLWMSVAVLGFTYRGSYAVFFSWLPPDIWLPDTTPLFVPLLRVYVHQEPTPQTLDQSDIPIHCHVTTSVQDGVENVDLQEETSPFGFNSSGMYLYGRSPLGNVLKESDLNSTTFSLRVECASPYATNSTTLSITITTFARWLSLHCPISTSESTLLCFMDNNYRYDVYENMNELPLGEFRPSLPMACEENDRRNVTYHLSDTNPAFRLVGDRLLLTQPLDREQNQTIHLTVTCDILGSHDQPVSRDISIHVQDVHDCGPVIPVRIQRTTFYRKLANLTLEPGEMKAIMFNDCEESNHKTHAEEYDVTIDGDPEHILHVSDITVSFGRKKIVFNATRQPERDVSANVVVTDRTTVSRDPTESEIRFRVFVKGRKSAHNSHANGHTDPANQNTTFDPTTGDVTNGERSVNESVETTAESPSGLAETTSGWSPAATAWRGQSPAGDTHGDHPKLHRLLINVSAAAAKYATVIELFNVTRGSFQYSKASDSESTPFGIVDDVVYVAQNLSEYEGETLTLDIVGVMAKFSFSTKVSLTVRIVAPALPAVGSCGSCSDARSKDACVATCGVGALSGRCTWVEAGGYSTCVADPGSCPDTQCDGPLEDGVPQICPQDCAYGGKGISAGARGVCYCHSSGEYCNCTVPEPKEAESTESSGKNSQLVLVLSLVMGCVVSSCVLLVLWRCRGRIRQGAMKHVSSIVSLSAVPSDYVDDSDRTAGLLGNVDWTAHLLDARFKPDPEWEFPRKHLRLEKTLGEGEFGRVVKARALGIQGAKGFTTVAVKMLKECASTQELRDLLSEYALLKDVSHNNVIKLLGVSSQNGPFYLIVEFCEDGSLRSYLRRSRQACYITPNAVMETDDVISSGPNLKTTGISDVLISEKDLMSFAWQTAKGMQYLCEMKLVHRDLAARNILIATGKVVKISDFGLTRDIYEGDAYLKRSKGRIPVKWMAPESLYDQVYTSKSDVWSFGVVLWEIATLGATPYPGVPPERLYQMIKTGYRLDKPQGCSDELFQIMQQCWKEDPAARHAFKHIASQFEAMLKASASYLDLTYQSERHLVLDDDTSDSMGFSNIKGDVISQDPEYGSINILSTDVNSYVLTPKLHNSADVTFSDWSSRDHLHSANSTAKGTRGLRAEPDVDEVSTTNSQNSMHEREGLMSEHRV